MGPEAISRKRSEQRPSRASGELEGSPARASGRSISRHIAVRKAVFPVASVDTGLLPATKAAPKEMLTVVDKPLIHYAVEEAIAAGIREMIFVTNRNKRAIEDHFDMAYELEATLAKEAREHELLDLKRLFPSDVRYLYVRQPEYTGLGSALQCARALVGEEPFALILPDELIDGKTPAVSQMLECFRAMQQPVVGVQALRAGDRAVDSVRTGGASYRERTHHVLRFERASAPMPGDLIAVGRYILTSSVFDALEFAARGGERETGLHDALQSLIAREPVVACEIEGERFSCRTKFGLLSATVHYGLKHPELAEPFRELLRSVRASNAPLGPTHV